MSAPQMQTPGCNRASAQTKQTTAIIGDDLSADKPFKSLQAAFALKGHALYRTDPRDGPVSFYATRWGLVRNLSTLDDCRVFLAQIGGAE